jgi:hypothetical protein
LGEKRNGKAGKKKDGEKFPHFNNQRSGFITPLR